VSPVLIGGLALLILGAALLWNAARLRRRAGLPSGRVVYSDTRTWRECLEPLYAADVNLAGKPDYLVRKWRYTIPVEVKSSAPPAEPYRSHVLQLAAYCLLVDREYGVRPPYGMIHYPGRTFAVPYTPELEDELLDTIEWMREDLRTGRSGRNHDDPVRCRACGHAPHCDQRLD